MSAGRSTIQQTLTQDAASVVDDAIAEACRRNHRQTTPLHVAATLFASPSGFLCQACITLLPSFCHPLWFMALEVYFSVALGRLPTAQHMEPPISVDLMAAIKRAQAHERVEQLEQLTISILDDPSVTRVIKEAGFSTSAVKGIIERLLNRNLRLNPRLELGWEVNRIVNILMRKKNRNPLLVGESEPEAVIKELLKTIGNRELGDGAFCNGHVIDLEKVFPSGLKELGYSIETAMGTSRSGGLFINLGDLKWLVKKPMDFGVLAGRGAVAEMGRLLAKFGAMGTGRLWFLGTATSETYYRCRLLHPSMENDWDMQALPIDITAPLLEIFPRLSRNAERFPETIDNENKDHCHSLEKRFAGKGKEKTCEFNVDQCLWPLFTESSEEYSDRSDSKSDEFSGPS